MSANELMDNIVADVNEIRARQETDGSIKNPLENDFLLLTDLMKKLRKKSLCNIYGLSPSLLSAILEDLSCWLKNGLEAAPAFDAAIAAFKYPAPGETLFFLAAMRATNGPQPEGFRLELVYGVRQETFYLTEAKQYTKGYIAPFQCIQLQCASEGFSTGNCIVLFPESVATVNKVEKQGFALFFFNKFFSIYNKQTLPEVGRLFGASNGIISGSLSTRNMSEADTYDARCLWGYYHDYAHHTGPRPLDKNLYLKQNWFVGLLEETKCDIIAARLVQKFRPVFWQEIFEFILLERMFRYPQNSTEQNITFDAGTGILLFELFFKAKALKQYQDGYLKFDCARLEACMDAIIEDIESMERLPEVDYISAAKKYVQKHLGLPRFPAARFDFTKSWYCKIVQGGTR